MDDNIKNIIVDLDVFSRLPPNTLVHMNTFGRFIITAPQFAYIYGVQTLTNLWKGHTTQKLIYDLNKFSKNIIYTLNNLLIDKENIKIVLILVRDFNLGYKGDTENGGMKGLLETLKYDPLIIELTNTINSLKQSINEIKIIQYHWVCPILFLDDWEKR
jgi:hypothetical protein